MDATVTDFLNEINQIAPKKDSKQQPEVWHECYDELTGYSYYWNTQTDEVTWTTPKLFKPAENNPKRTNQAKPSHITVEKKKPELFVPPSAPQYANSSVNPEAKTKIYSIQEAVQKPEVKKSIAPIVKNTSKRIPVKRRPPGNHDESDDEKIELITEYGEDSDSEIEEQIVLPSNTATQIKQSDSQSDEDDDIDLLAKIQQRAQELKKLGGEVPPEVKNIIQKTHVKDKQEKPKMISGFSLVAGYNSASSDSESEQEKMHQSPPKQIFPVAPPPKPILETSHSTLFPITQPIDVKDFIGPSPTLSETVKVPENSTGGDFDSKAFQRKRRIGISLVNSGKRPKEDVEREVSEFTGLGFKAETDQNGTTEKKGASSVYPGFQKGGLMFVKSNVLNATLPSKEMKVQSAVDAESSIDIKETDDVYNVLRQKLVFLGEGRAPVLPVQVMLIQAETLFIAMKEGGLKLSYLHNWLQETSSELIKLEKEAAPEGWLLQWDRSHNRYFYQNQATGESQWGYPQPDISRFDDLMDISTTPPPPDLPEPPPHPKPMSPVAFGPQLPVEPPLPPSPPKIRDPTPPPPPVISLEPKTIFSDVPLPPEPLPPPPPPPKKTFENGEPLPPGVDLPEVVPYNPPKDPEIKPSDTLSSALDSFYSEIAEATENTNSNSPSSSLQFPEVPSEVPEDFQIQMNAGDVVKKKKKKVKLAQGLTMKKKGVSQLVEKWKNVQKNYSD